MVRRAEYALGKAIRKGQAEGKIASRGSHPYYGNQHAAEVHDSNLSKVTDYASKGDLYGNGQGTPGVMHISHAESDVLDAALAEAKSEGNLSRTNVVRKVKGEAAKITGEQRSSWISLERVSLLVPPGGPH